MKKPNRKIPKNKIKELAEQFKSELDSKLPVTVLPNGGIIYKEFLIKENKQGNWAVYNYKSQQFVAQFFLKTCALMAAKAYALAKIEQFWEIKRLDNQYWANHIDSQVFQRNMKITKEYERYQILLTRFENSKAKEQHYKEEISKMFKWSFV